MKKIDIPAKQISKDLISIATPKEENHPNIFEYYDGITIELLRYKTEKHIPFTKNDLIYLYDIYNLMRNNNEILNNVIIGRNRNVASDMATIFDCNLDEVTTSQKELKKNPSKYVVLLDDFDMGNYHEYGYANKYPRLKYIMGICHAFFCLDIGDTFPVLEATGSNLDLYNITSSKGLESLKSIGGHASFNNLYDATGLCNLEIIGGTARFHSLKSAKGLEKLRHIGLIANFDNLESTDGFSNLEYIGELERSYFNSLPTNSFEKIKTRVRTK